MTNISLSRRGHELGTVEVDLLTNKPDEKRSWAKGDPILLEGLLTTELDSYARQLEQSESLYQNILEQQECDALLLDEPYHSQWSTQFESLGSSFNEGDEQEIETILFDAIENNKVVAEDLWIKISWLSFYDEDASLRFRFSFGVDFEEDVAADQVRQHYAATLTDAIFPESNLITNNNAVVSTLAKLLDSPSLRFVERIIYFNAPQGGAYLHHDRERGHAGVVYAQLSGTTYWLALPKHVLLQEISLFIERCIKHQEWPSSIDQQMQTELIALQLSERKLSSELESFSNSTLIHLINETEGFIQQLIQHGHGYLVKAGDLILLPQKCDTSCCWHSVFNIGEQAGQALSFAVRADTSPLD